MRISKPDWLKWLMISGLLFVFIISGCNSTSPVSPTAESSANETLAVSTATSEPLPTQTPLPQKVVLITDGLDEVSRTSLAVAAADFAAQSGLLFEERLEFQTSEIELTWKAVILSAGAPGLSDALAVNPGIQFIVLSDHDLTMSPNLNVIRMRREKQAFLAGYLSILITPDWRAAGLFAPEAIGDTEDQAFRNGGQYFCGICNPYYAPLMRFPISGRIASSADASVWQADLDTLLSNIIYTVYVSPASESTELLDTLAQRGMVLIGGDNPAEALRTRWAVSVILDAAAPLVEMWPDISAGQGGITLEAPVLLTSINEDFLTPGKQRLANEVMEKLNGGWIHPLDIPAQ